MPDDAPNPMRDRNLIHNSAPTLTTQQARQGETSGRMRIVLGISLLVAILVVVGLAFEWHEARTPPATNAQDTAPNAPQPHDQVPGNTTPTPPNNQGNN